MNTRTALLLIGLNLLAACNGDGDGTDVFDSNINLPSIKGQPSGSSRTGQDYPSTPEVPDVDDDLMSFSIAHKPGWAFFDSASGRVSGVPQMTDYSRYADITISVIDGTSTTPVWFSVQGLQLPFDAAGKLAEMNGEANVPQRVSDHLSLVAQAGTTAGPLSGGPINANTDKVLNQEELADGNGHTISGKFL